MPACRWWAETSLPSIKLFWDVTRYGSPAGLQKIMR
jgi:hypothetical protein